MSRQGKRKSDRLTRRSLLKGAAALGGAALGTGIGGFPTVWAQNIKNVTGIIHAAPLVFWNVDKN